MEGGSEETGQGHSEYKLMPCENLGLVWQPCWQILETALQKFCWLGCWPVSLGEVRYRAMKEVKFWLGHLERQRFIKSLNKFFENKKRQLLHFTVDPFSLYQNHVSTQAMKLALSAHDHLETKCTVCHLHCMKCEEWIIMKKSVAMLANWAKALVSWSNFSTEGIIFSSHFLFLLIILT